MTAALTAADLRCPVTGKSAYADEQTAMQWVERAWTDPNWENRHGQMPTRAYLCPDCGWWHLTSKRARS